MGQAMQAVGCSHYGGAEVLEALTLPIPAPGPNGVLIKVAAAGVNPADWRLRSGQFRFAMRLRLPFVPGSDIAGVVEAVGVGVSQFRPGDPVYAESIINTPRERVSPATGRHGSVTGEAPALAPE